MALTCCTNCGREMSTAAYGCPGCGRPAYVPVPTADPLASRRQTVQMAYILTLVALVLWPACIAALLMAYANRGEVRGTWLESHYRWQIGTFWISLAWGLGSFVLILPFVAAGAVGWGIAVAVVSLLASCAWWVYRIVIGWIRFGEGRAVGEPG